MNTLARYVSRPTLRRTYATRPVRTYNQGWTKEAEEELFKKHSTPENVKLWQNIFVFMGIPSLILATVNAYLGEMEHKKHWKRPEFKKYECDIHRKDYPWGDGKHGLFHNKLKNPLPDGYEPMDDEEVAHH